MQILSMIVKKKLWSKHVITIVRKTFSQDEYKVDGHKIRVYNEYYQHVYKHFSTEYKYSKVLYNNTKKSYNVIN